MRPGIERGIVGPTAFTTGTLYYNVGLTTGFFFGVIFKLPAHAGGTVLPSIVATSLDVIITALRVWTTYSAMFDVDSLSAAAAAVILWVYDTKPAAFMSSGVIT
jgi:hypothetical protein